MISLLEKLRFCQNKQNHNDKDYYSHKIFELLIRLVLQIGIGGPNNFYLQCAKDILFYNMFYGIAKIFIGFKETNAQSKLSGSSSSGATGVASNAMENREEKENVFVIQFI